MTLRHHSARLPGAACRAFLVAVMAEGEGMGGFPPALEGQAAVLGVADGEHCDSP